MFPGELNEGTLQSCAIDEMLRIVQPAVWRRVGLRYEWRRCDDRPRAREVEASMVRHSELSVPYPELRVPRSAEQYDRHDESTCVDAAQRTQTITRERDRKWQ